MTFLWALIPSPIKRGLGWLLAGLLLVLGVFRAGKRDARKEAKIKGLEADRDANRRIDDADISRGDTDADTEWLSGRAKK